VTTNTYDGDNRLVAVVTSELRTRLRLRRGGQQDRITDANGHTITQVFNENNQLVLTIDPSATAAALTEERSNTTWSNRTEVTDAEGNKTTYAFDARRQLIDVATPTVQNGAEQSVSYHETYAYDGEGNAVTLTDRSGNVTQNLYTPNGLLKRVTSAAGNVWNISTTPTASSFNHHGRAARSPARRLRFVRRREPAHRGDRCWVA
jgi:YD repeat-containing protein